MRIIKTLLCALLAMSVTSAALATDFPTPAYEWKLENTSPDTKAIQAAVAPYWAEEAEQGSSNDRSGANRWDLVYWVGHSRGPFNLTNDIYGVEDCPQAEAARPVAEAVLDSLGLDYVREPVLAKTAGRFQTDRWLGTEGFLDTDGTILWLCDQLAKEPMPMEAVPTLATYMEMRDE